MGPYEISPNHKLLAYGLDTTGAESYTIYFKNLESGEILQDKIEGSANSIKWLNNITLLYTTRDHIHRPDKVYRHILGTLQSDDEEIYHDSDPHYVVSLYNTRDQKYIIIGSFSFETYELHYLATSNPRKHPTVIHPREIGLRYLVNHRHDNFYILTNADGANNNKLVMTPVDNPERDNWKTLIEHRKHVVLDDVDLFANHLVCYERANGLMQIQITSFLNDLTHSIKFPEPIFTVAQGNNPKFDTDTLRINYSSMTTPLSIFDYNMDTCECELKWQEPVLGNYDPANYVTERIYANIDKGTQIPISLVYRKDAWDGSPTHLHLQGYGAYGITLDPTFDSFRITLLDRGIIFAFAHVRGGQIMGRQWYDDGKLLQKRNTFEDFIVCAKYLIKNSYTSPEVLSIEGHSAGGLLVATVLNISPKLFIGAIVGIPLVDIVTTMLDESLPLTIGEWEEWGNPQNPEYYDYMLSYSPYDNITAQEYPHILVTGGLNDQRVQYWEPVKYVAKLRAFKTDDNHILLKMQSSAGHFSLSGFYDRLSEVAFNYAFLLNIHGLV